MSAVNRNAKEDESKLQAVIIADTFNENFQPISADLPVVLLPLVNSTCLDYTLNWLRRSLIDETFIYCQSKYLSQFEESCKTWLIRTFGMKVHLIPLENMSSIGDAMRDLYAKSLIKSDFILLSGNVIGNMFFKNLIDIHKEQRKAYSSIVMSCVYLRYDDDWGEEHYSLATLFTHLPSSKLLVHHRPPGDLIIPKRAVDTAKNGGGRLLVRMCDPNVLICSEMLPSLFSDNFDYDTKESLINGIIGEEDLMGYTINFMQDKEGFCLNVDNFGVYEKISISLIARDVLPLACEKSQSTDRIRYKVRPFPIIYHDTSASFSRDSVWDYVVIDAATVVHEGAFIEKCSVGKHCEIGDKTNIKRSFIQNNVKIGDNCSIDRCYIADGVTILSGVTLQPGVIIGNNITVGPNVTIPTRTRLVSTHYNNGFTKSNADIIGEQGKGFVYEPTYPKKIYNCRWGIDLSMEKELAEASSDEESEEEPEQLEEILSDEESFEDFTREVRDSLLTGLTEKSDPENIILEINASRHAYNVKLEDVQKIVVKNVLQAVESKGETPLSGEELWQTVKQSLNTFSAVISNYVKKPKDQITVLVAIEELICEEERYMAIVQKVLFQVNQELELLDDEIIVKWFYDYKEHSEKFPVISKLIKTFIEWLEDEESD